MRTAHWSTIAVGLVGCCLLQAAWVRGEPIDSPALSVSAELETAPQVPSAEEIADRRNNWSDLWRPVARQSPEAINPWTGLYFGTSIVFAKPHLKESFQANILQPATGTMTRVPFSSDYRAAPRAWLGFGGLNGFGVQTRYWEYNQEFNPFDFVTSATALPGAQAVTVVLPAAILSTIPGDVLSVRSGIEMRSLDLEGTVRHELQGSQLLISGGLRYAMIRQDYEARVISGVFPSSLTWDRKLEGVGPIIGAQLRRPIGRSSLALVGGGRAGLIFASKDIHRTAVNALPAPPSNPVVNFDNADELLMNLEMELGMEWSRRLSFGDIFLRGTYEGQLWSDSGGSALGYLGVEGFGVSVGFSR